MKSPNKFRPGAMHVFHALKAALNGYREAWQHEDAFRQELFVAAILIPVALFLPADKVGKLLMVCSIVLVLILVLPCLAIAVECGFQGMEHMQSTRTEFVRTLHHVTVALLQ